MNETATHYLDEVFGEGGLLAANTPNYESRPQQVELAGAVDRAFAEGRHLLAEGPTGCGKSYANLIPAIHHAVQQRKKVIYATANISLQEQLYQKDLPFLKKTLLLDFSYVLVKGINNYLCLDKYYEYQVQPFFDYRYEDEIKQIAEWAEGTKTGDVAELDFQPPGAVWSKFSASSEQCLGKECPYYLDCFGYAARNKAHFADVIVVNYHLLFAHVQIRKETGMDIILPEFDFVICDEGHKMADIARDFFGFKVGRIALLRLGTTLGKLNAENIGRTLKSDTEQYFSEVKDFYCSGKYQVRLKERGSFRAEALLSSLSDAIGFLRQEQDRLSEPPVTDNLKELSNYQRKYASVKRSLKTAEQLRVRLKNIDQLADPDSVYWIDQGHSDFVSICAKPIFVNEHLKTHFFDMAESVITTSATLSTNGNFNFIKKELGIDNPLELEVSSPFDFKEQAILVVPDNIPFPNDSAFVDVVADQFDRIIHSIGGRTLGLFTSYRNLNGVYDRISGNGHKLLRQGDAPRSLLTRQFKNAEEAVLLGTESFWAGVDVPGESLSCVIIDKLPFPTPDDPVMDAISKRNRKWFKEYSVPRAIIALKQGFGRLIRSRSDRGACVLFDRRVIDKRYGKHFLDSLPDMLKSRSIESVSHFLGIDL